MRKFSLILVLLACVSTADAQLLGASPIRNHLLNDELKFALAENTNNPVYNVFLFMPTVPFVVGGVDIEHGQTKVNNSILFGPGGTFVLGKGTYAESGFDMSPSIFFGFALNTGFTASEGVAHMKLCPTGFFGFGDQGLSLGYDVLNDNSWTIGLTFKWDLPATLAENLYWPINVWQTGQ